MLNFYKHILFVTDLKEDSKVVAEKVKAIAKKNKDSKVSVLHIILDNIIAGGYEVMPLFDYNENSNEIGENQKKLHKFITDCGLKDVDSEVVETLSTSTGIVDYAEENNVDLIVLGLHKRKGFFEHLLGSTASAILDDTPCDVLSIVIPHEED